MKKKLVLTCLLTICITLLIGSYTNVKVYAATETGVAGIVTSLEKVNYTYYNWSTDRVNIRKEASINSDIITTLEKRTKVEVLKKTSSSDWVKVKYNDNIGYVYYKYLRDIELPSLYFTDKEIDLIAKIMWLEARSESDDGEAAVCIVIINRLLSLEFSDTVYEVLSDKGEFSTWKLIDTAKPTEREYEIIDEVMNGLWDVLLTSDTLYFSTKPRNNNVVAHIGAHYFCED